MDEIKTYYYSWANNDYLDKLIALTNIIEWGIVAKDYHSDLCASYILHYIHNTDSLHYIHYVAKLASSDSPEEEVEQSL